MASNTLSSVLSPDDENQITAIQAMEAESIDKVVPDSGATHNDKNDMHRMGKIQEFKVSLS
jgi:ABC-type xylose transport system substrate-binding protein